MNIWVIILVVVLAFALLGGGYGGYYPRPYGFGGFGLVIIVLLILWMTGRL